MEHELTTGKLLDENGEVVEFVGDTDENDDFSQVEREVYKEQVYTEKSYLSYSNDSDDYNSDDQDQDQEDEDLEEDGFSITELDEE